MANISITSAIFQNNLARRREQMKHIALMPDLKESRESFISAEDPTGSNGVKAPEDKGLTMKTTIDFDLNSEPSPETDKVFPSIPDSFLKKHDLTFKKDENITNRYCFTDLLSIQNALSASDFGQKCINL